MSEHESAMRRVELTLHKPWFALYAGIRPTLVIMGRGQPAQWGPCLLYTSDAADERSSVDLGGRRIIKKKKNNKYRRRHMRIENTREQLNPTD